MELCVQSSICLYGMYEDNFGQCKQLDYRLEGAGFESDRASGPILWSKHSDRLWGPLNFLVSGYSLGFLPGSRATRM